MLRVSANNSNIEVDIQAVNGDATAAGKGIPFGLELMKFAEAVVSRDEDALNTARNVLLQEAGAEVLVDAAAVAGNFQRMVRIADATGIPLDERSAAVTYGVAKELNLRRFATAQHTPTGGLKRKVMSWIARPMAKRMFKKMAR